VAAAHDENGETISLIYPGRLNDSRGGDFRDAVIGSPEGLKRGCIEVHTLTSGWRSHGHHLDPHYNQVVLQVAWSADRGGPARSENGRSIPTVLLQQRLQDVTGTIPPPGGLACRNFTTLKGTAPLEEILNQAGEQRLILKSRSFQEEMRTVQAEQVLYQGLVQALGYSHNQAAFLDFAQRVPLANSPEITASMGEKALFRLQAFLIGRAGLLPSQRGLNLPPHDYIQELEKVWRDNAWQALTPLPIWDLYRVRPGNFPVRRLIALSQWLWQGRFNHWKDKFLITRLDNSDCQSRQALGNNLRVDDSGYWSSHFDFGNPVKSLQSAILGESRVSEMIINVVYPFILAWANTCSHRDLASRVTFLYRVHPSLASNSIQRHMSAQLDLSSKSLNSACRQQGLLHIYKTLCTQGRCPECPLAV
jgi:hypothetical protein